MGGDRIDGGADSDRIVLNGDFSGGVHFGPGAISTVETILLTSALPGGYNSYNITMGGGSVAAA